MYTAALFVHDRHADAVVQYLQVPSSVSPEQRRPPWFKVMYYDTVVLSLSIYRTVAVTTTVLHCTGISYYTRG